MWKLIAALAPLSFVGFQALSKALPKSLSPFFVNGIASLVGAVFMFTAYLATKETTALSEISNRSWSFIVGIGLLISFGNYLVIKAFNLGADQSTFTAIFNPAYIIFGLLAGWLIWQEKLTVMQLSGTGLAVVGIILIAYGSR